MLHCLQNVIHAHSLASFAEPFLAWLWPNLIEAWNDEVLTVCLESRLFHPVSKFTNLPRWFALCQSTRADDGSSGLHVGLSSNCAFLTVVIRQYVTQMERNNLSNPETDNDLGFTCTAA